MLGVIIKNYIVKKGIKQSVMSKQTGISKCRLNQLLNGSGCMKADEYIMICLFLELSCDYFVRGNYNANIK